MNGLVKSDFCGQSVDIFHPFIDPFYLSGEEKMEKKVKKRLFPMKANYNNACNETFFRQEKHRVDHLTCWQYVSEKENN